MDTFSAIDEDLVMKNRSIVEQAGLLVLDGNIPVETMRATLDIAARNRVPGQSYISIYFYDLFSKLNHKLYMKRERYNTGSASTRHC